MRNVILTCCITLLVYTITFLCLASFVTPPSPNPIHCELCKVHLRAFYCSMQQTVSCCSLYLSCLSWTPCLLNAVIVNPPPIFISNSLCKMISTWEIIFSYSCCFLYFLFFDFNKEIFGVITMILLGADFPSSQRTHFTIPLLGASEQPPPPPPPPPSPCFRTQPVARYLEL
jgi:hypothetical protein